MAIRNDKSNTALRELETIRFVNSRLPLEEHYSRLWTLHIAHFKAVTVTRLT